MTGWLKEWKNLKTWLSLIPAISYALLIVSLVWADSDRPRDVVYYNEMLYILFIVMLTYLLFQREIAGSMMELNAVYRRSMAALILRKASVVIVLFTVLHLAWYGVYIAKFGVLKTNVFSWTSDAIVFAETGWLHLYLQALPGYLLIMVLTMWGIVISRSLYGGLGVGLGFWLLEALGGGRMIPYVTLMLYAKDPEQSFLVNRLFLIAIAIVFALWALLLLSRRERWVTKDELE